VHLSNFPADVRSGSQPARADSRSGHVGFPPIATGFCFAAIFHDVPKADIVDSETGEKHGGFDRMSSLVTLMPGLYDLQSPRRNAVHKGRRWQDGHAEAHADHAQPESEVGEGARDDSGWQEVFRFDRVTWQTVLPPGETMCSRLTVGKFLSRHQKATCSI
jgi:hypothetical protein